jgi:hypothetical protein
MQSITETTDKTVFHTMYAYGKHFRVSSVIMLITYIRKIKAMPIEFPNYISTSNGSFVHSRFQYFAANVRPRHTFWELLARKRIPRSPTVVSHLTAHGFHSGITVGLK